MGENKIIQPETRKFINKGRGNALGARDDLILAIKEAVQIEAAIPKKALQKLAAVQ